MRLICLLIAAACFVRPAAVPAAVTPANVANLAPKWTVTGGAVTGGGILHDGRLYAGSWDSRVFALDPTTGTEIWSRNVGGLVPGRVLVLDDGGICYGTIGLGQVGCLDGATGAVRWQRDVSEPLAGQVWSAPAAATGRLFVGVAGLTDDPASRGRLLALDLATGDELWRFYTVPEKVCTTDTATTCTLDADCPASGTCVIGLGAGITASPLPDPTGDWVYISTVGSFTFPSIGYSDSTLKIDASTGIPVWDNRVSAPEQFGACAQDTSVDCGVDADCAGVGGTCEEKAAYHDFGFVNGPIRIQVPDGGGTKTLIVSASKNGTIYAFDEATGMEEWKNVVRIEPVTPGFAGFGLFNGAIDYADGRIFAALNVLAPARVCSNDARVQCSNDGQCPGGTCPPEPKHLMAFDAATGATLWAEEIGRSWSHVAVANGIVYAGTRTEDAQGASSLFAHDAATGARLATLPLPGASTARAAVDENSVYIGFGEGGAGGLVAFSLCANNVVDDGEECDHGPTGSACCTVACKLVPGGTACTDDGNACTADVCDDAGTCLHQPLDASPCDDGDACTGGDQCTAGTCGGAITTIDQVGCKLDAFTTAPCGDATLPNALGKTIARTIQRIERLFGKAASLAASGKTERAERLRQKAMKGLDTIAAKAAKAAAAKKESKRISAECRASIDALVTSRRAVLGAFAF